jgi:hypothetical protein
MSLGHPVLLLLYSFALLLLGVQSGYIQRAVVALK